jgi:Uma2 family endonuclease
MTRIIEVVQRYEIPEIPELDLPDEDGEPLETNWHRAQINLLIDVVYYRWRGRNDFFAGGNMFIYYSIRQARNRDYKGPDFFLVKHIESGHSRPKWVVWEEDGRYPNVIVELMSPTTRHEDLGRKKRLYEQTFQTRDYFCYDPDTEELLGWTLSNGEYRQLEPDENGRLWSSEFNAWIGLWPGEFLGTQDLWLRLFDEDGNLWPTYGEGGQSQADAERERADAAQAQADRLAAQLRALGVEPEE